MRYECSWCKTTWEDKKKKGCSSIGKGVSSGICKKCANTMDKYLDMIEASERLTRLTVDLLKTNAEIKSLFVEINDRISKRGTK